MPNPFNTQGGTNYIVSGILAVIAAGITSAVITTLSVSTLQMTEQAAPSAASGKAVVYADSTTHNLDVAQNNGSFKSLTLGPAAGQVTIAGPTAARTLTIPDASATMARTDAANTFTGHQTIEGVTSTGATGTNLLVFATSPTLTTPNIGAATATSINGNTITTGTGTLTLGAGKTTTFDHTSTFTTTDSQTYTFPTTSATIARTDAGQTFTGVQAFTSPTISTTCSLIGDTINAKLQHLAEDTTTAAGYTLVLADDCEVVTVNTAGANTLSIPTNASVAFPVGTQITVIQKGAGQWTIQAANSGTTTVVSNGGTAAAPKLRAQYSACTLWKDATDHWYVFGDIQ
jgi:hypothetical protein